MGGKGKEVQDLVAEVADQGWRVKDRGGKVLLFPPDPRTIVTLHWTPFRSQLAAKRRRGRFRQESPMINQWSVAIAVAAGGGHPRVPKLTERSGVLLDALIDRRGVTTADRGGRRYGARFRVEAAGPVEAAERAITVFRQAAADAGLPAWDVVEVEVLTEAELERQNALPSLPELVGVTEVAELLEVSRQRASTLARSAGFPPPVVTLRSGPVWTRSSVDRFVQSWRRQPGRSAATRPDSGGAAPLTVRRQTARVRGDRGSG